MDYKGNKKLVPLAKTLRKNMTKEEKHLWYDFLRSHTAGFRRQKILGKYILDFYSAKEQISIEVDGEHHYSEKKFAADIERTNYINGFGISVLRFSNKEIQENFSGVCQFIDEYITNKRLKNKAIDNRSPVNRY